jgi:hypothetical protein
MAALLLLAGCGGSTGTTSRAVETWSSIPEVPLSPRSGAGMVWAGDRLVVWSGADRTATADRRLTDGAMWLPEIGWQQMVPPPDAEALVPGGFAVWTGREVVFGPVAPAAAGGRPQSADGPALLAYSPVSDSWRRMAPDDAVIGALGDTTGPFSGVAVMVGSEMLIGGAGGRTGTGRQPGRLVALDPATGTARMLDPGPFDTSPYPDLSGEVLVTVTGDKLLAAPNWSAEAWALDPSGPGTWTRTSPPPIVGLHLNDAVWTGAEAVFLANTPPVAYEPSTDRWRALAPAPSGRDWARLDGAGVFRRAGDRILLEEGIYDPATDAWHALPSLPVPGTEVRLRPFVDWTGDAVVVFGGGSYECPVDATCDIDESQIDWTQEGWTYRP